MAEQAALLQAQNDLIRAANAELERRVAERTHELSELNRQLLLVNQHSWLALLNAIGSILLGITAAAVGWWAGSKLA